MAALAALGAMAGLAFAGRRRAVPLPAGNTLGERSPAVLDATPRRRFYRGRRPARAQTIEDLRAMAHRRLPRFALEYLEGGAEGEASLARNLAALAEWRFLHRSFVDVSRVDVSTRLFGEPMAMPLAVAPTGLNGLFWPGADLCLARAAAAAGVPFAQSTMSNETMEAVAKVPGLRFWWQLYVFGPAKICDALIDRALQAGCEALVLTADAEIYGNREWEARTRAGPKSLSPAAALECLRHPAWLARGLLARGLPRFANVIDFVPGARRGFFDSAYWIRSQMDRSLSWLTVAEIRRRWPRKLIVKGLLDLRDIVRATDAGADAVAISNHGGRQLDCEVAPLDLLPAAREAVGDRIAILIDGGCGAAAMCSRRSRSAPTPSSSAERRFTAWRQPASPARGGRWKFCAAKSSAIWACSASRRWARSSPAFLFMPPPHHRRAAASSAAPIPAASTPSPNPITDRFSVNANCRQVSLARASNLPWAR
jgi:(S)-mandelate dehydrogenase